MNSQQAVTDAMVEAAAEAYWLKNYTSPKDPVKRTWPHGVFGGSADLFRQGCRAALEAALAQAQAKPVEVPEFVPAQRLEQIIGTQTVSHAEAHDMAVELIIRRRAAAPECKP